MGTTCLRCWKLAVTWKVAEITFHKVFLANSVVKKWIAHILIVTVLNSKNLSIQTYEKILWCCLVSKVKQEEKDKQQYFIQDSMHDTLRLELKTFFFFVKLSILFALNRNPYILIFDDFIFTPSGFYWKCWHKFSGPE